MPEVEAAIPCLRLLQQRKGHATPAVCEIACPDKRPD